jgi:hypothetical protein
MAKAKQIVERHVDAFNAHQPDADPWAEDAEFVAPGASMRGREDVLAFLDALGPCPPAIAAGINSDGVLTGKGGQRWYPGDRRDTRSGSSSARRAAPA